MASETASDLLFKAKCLKQPGENTQKKGHDDHRSNDSHKGHEEVKTLLKRRVRP